MSMVDARELRNACGLFGKIIRSDRAAPLIRKKVDGLTGTNPVQQKIPAN